MANVDDYKVAYEIAQIVLAQTLKELTPVEERLLQLIEKDFTIEEFSPKDLMKVRENESENTARNYLKHLYKKGFRGWNGGKE